MAKYQDAYADPIGPGDARPTALQIVEDENLIGKLDNFVFFITGANQGLGLETARALHATGATIFMGVRDMAKGKQAVDNILSSAPTPHRFPKLHLIHLRLDSLASVRSAAKSFLRQSPKLNVLVLNAGIMATPKDYTEDGFETQFGVNYLSHFLLFELLKPALLQSSTDAFRSRVVSLSSQGHRLGGVRLHDFNFNKPDSYDPWMSYAQSKTANIYLANEIEKRFGKCGLHGLSVHPGLIMTNLSRHLDQKSNPDIARFLRDAQQGAASTVHAAISKSWEGRGGVYIADCVEQGPVKSESLPTNPDDLGYSPWAFDEEKFAMLWETSYALVGIPTSG